MKYNSSQFLKAFAISLGFFVLATGCKENVITSADLLPPIDNITVFGLDANDMNLELRNKIFDSLRTDDVGYAVGAVGVLKNDPFFGSITGGEFFQVSVPSAAYQFPADINTMDSAVLVVPYTGVAYGDTTGAMTASYKVFRIMDASFKADTSATKYYAVSNVNVAPTAIGNTTTSMAAVKKEVFSYPSGDSTIGQLRINLGKSFAEEIKAQDVGTFQNNSNFVNYLNGFYLVGDAAGAATALHYFRLDYPASTTKYQKARLELYFRNTAGANGFVVFPFYRTINTFFNRLERDFGASPAAAFKASEGRLADTALIQGAPGFNTYFTINNISTKIPEGSLINQAKLTVTVPKTGVENIFANPNVLILSGIDDFGNEFALADYLAIDPQNNTEAQLFVGGIQKATIISGITYTQYVFNFPRELQRSRLAGKDNLTIKIAAAANLPGAYRMFAYGPNSGGAANMKLNIIYTKN